jgi:hypothetical protein
VDIIHKKNKTATIENESVMKLEIDLKKNVLLFSGTNE